jgi:hypothetical protein
MTGAESTLMAPTLLTSKANVVEWPTRLPPNVVLTARLAGQLVSSTTTSRSFVSGRTSIRTPATRFEGLLTVQPFWVYQPSGDFGSSGGARGGEWALQAQEAQEAQGVVARDNDTVGGCTSSRIQRDP